MSLYKTILKKFKSKNKFDLVRKKDIIWCRRYKNKWQEKNIIEGHRHGPYIVLKKTKRRAYCLYCTSTKKDNLIDDAYYKLDKEKYNFDKESFVSLYEIKTINKDQYIKKLNTLSDSDFSKLKKLVKVKTNNKTMKKNYLRAKIFKNKIDLYDIISVQDKLYYIYDIEGKYYKCYKISKHSKCKHPITINGTIYSFDFNNKEKIKKRSKVKLVGTACHISSNIESLRLKLLEEQNLKMYKKVKRGNLLSINDRLYYVYGLCHNTLLTYQVFGNSKKAHYKLIIAGGMYYTDFTLKELVKGSNYRIKRCASDSEIEDIKNIYEAFKNRKKERIKKKSEVKLKNIKERCVILDERSNKKYLVIKRCGNTITCVSYPSLDILKEFRLDKVKNISLHERLENIEYGNMVIMIKNKYGEIFD